MTRHALHLRRPPRPIEGRSIKSLAGILLSGTTIVLICLVFGKPSNTRQLWIAPYSSTQLQTLPAQPDVLNVFPPTSEVLPVPYPADVLSLVEPPV